MITLEDVKKNEEVQELIVGAQKQMDAIGYTEHSIRHISIVSNRAARILETLEYPKDRIELAKIAGYMHDIGNCVNRVDHAHSRRNTCLPNIKRYGNGCKTKNRYNVSNRKS